MTEQQSDTVKVFDTWVNGKGGRLHFDVMTTDETAALKLAKAYLTTIGEADATITSRECRFCHSEPLVFFSADQQKQFKEQGGFILPLSA
jgi:heterodisulfide reductase subunit B